MKKLTDAQVEEIIAETGHDLGTYGTTQGPAYTADTLADFAASAGKDWKFERLQEWTTESGIKVVCYTKTQARAGDQRRDLVIADMGDYRVAGRL